MREGFKHSAGSRYRVHQARCRSLIVLTAVWLLSAWAGLAADLAPVEPRDEPREGPEKVAAERPGDPAGDVIRQTTSPTLFAAQLPVSIQGFRLAPDGHTLAVAGGDKSLRLYDGEFHLHARIELGLKAVSHDAFAFFPAGGWLAVTSGRARAVILTSPAGKIEKSLPLGEDAHLYNDYGLAPLALAPGGRYLAVPDSEAVRIIDTQTWETVATQPAHVGARAKLCFSADGSALAVSTDEKSTTCRLLRAPTFDTGIDIPAEKYFTAPLQAADTGIVSLSEQRVLQLNSATDGKILARLESEKFDIQGFCARPGSRYVIVLRGGAEEPTALVQLVDAKTLEIRKEFKVEGLTVREAALSPGDGYLAVVGQTRRDANQVPVWRVEDTTRVATQSNLPGGACREITFAGEDAGTLWFRSGEKTIYRWQWQTPAGP